LDEGFAEISELLEYRKDENKNKPRQPPKKPTNQPIKEEERNDWNQDIRAMMSKPKRNATDRTKPPEEVTKEAAETLHELETRRLARMNRDFEEDDFSDISVDDYKRKKPHHSNSKEEEEEKVQTRTQTQKNCQIRTTTRTTTTSPRQDLRRMVSNTLTRTATSSNKRRMAMNRKVTAIPSRGTTARTT
jgi:hypothetical protein